MLCEAWWRLVSDSSRSATLVATSCMSASILCHLASAAFMCDSSRSRRCLIVIALFKTDSCSAMMKVDSFFLMDMSFAISNYILSISAFESLLSPGEGLREMSFHASYPQSPVCCVVSSRGRTEIQPHLQSISFAGIFPASKVHKQPAWNHEGSLASTWGVGHENLTRQAPPYQSPTQKKKNCLKKMLINLKDLHMSSKDNPLDNNPLDNRCPTCVSGARRSIREVCIEHRETESSAVYVWSPSARPGILGSTLTTPTNALNRFFSRRLMRICMRKGETHAKSLLWWVIRVWILNQLNKLWRM